MTITSLTYNERDQDFQVGYVQIDKCVILTVAPLQPTNANDTTSIRRCLPICAFYLYASIQRDCIYIILYSTFFIPPLPLPTIRTLSFFTLIYKFTKVFVYISPLRFSLNLNKIAIIMTVINANLLVLRYYNITEVF